MTNAEKLVQLDTVDFQEQEWEQPIPFDDSVNSVHLAAQSFPIESLPYEVAAMVEALADSTQTPIEMGALLSLGVMAAVVQGRYEVQINSDWREQLSLYAVACAAPGERKSAVMGALTSPLYDYESERQMIEQGEVDASQAERRMMEKSLAEAESKAAKGKGSREEVRELAIELSGFAEKHPYRLLVDDLTAEKLANLMAQQGGKIAVVSAEGGLFDTMAGRYDRQPNLDLYLKGHSGDPYRSDRKHTVSHGTRTVEKDKTKNRASYRSFPLTDEVRQIIVDAKHREDINRKLFGSAYHENDYIFKWEDGRPYAPAFITHKFPQLLKKHQLPHIRFHELRHSCASNLIALGFTLKDVQEWLGHADIKLTANVYSHLDVSRKKHIAEAMGESLGEVERA